MNMQSGRTMVEMLGVLAIIGILSIGGIMGFRYAMNKYDANETVNRLTKRAVMISSQRLLGQNANLDDFDPNDGKFPIDLGIVEEDVFVLQAHEVTAEVCQQIANMEWTVAKMSPSDCSGSDLKFTFMNDLTDCTGCPTNDFDCTPYATAECGVCNTMGYTPRNNDCTDSSKPYCVNGKCNKCEANHFWDRGSNSCKPCVDDGSTTNWWTTTDYLHACLGSMYVGYYGGSPLLQACTKPSYSIGDVEEVSCKKCQNRCYLNGTCYLAGSNHLYSRKSEEDGMCSCNYPSEGACRCPTNHFWDKGSNSCRECFNTTSSSHWGTTSEYYHACLGSMMINSFWPGLIGCSRPVDPQPDVDETSCVACSNRCYNSDDRKCYFVGSGKTYLYKDTNGHCTNTAP